ncbi:MAG TPA: adenylate/guanylate cyclase domain-containing protein, partial [Acetobacteraceae bacterium]|nr:adenylate/guanylate cyclase domain-containing protein [Acetobacteraceae bacterium]
MAKPAGSENPGERKLLTVLFADLRGSFALISGRDPEQADEFLSAVTGEMQAAVVRHGGTVTRVMGDGIMAVFGAPHADEHHAARACMAALDMRRTVTGGPAAMAHVPDAPISIRIGLNSGEAVVRRVDSDSFAGYEVNGEAVHLAARMEQNAPENAILVAEDSARLVAAHFNLRAVQVGEVKGLANPIAVFELLSERSGATRPRALRAGPFVSRAQEVSVVAAARQAAAGGHGRMVIIRGEAGLGKSRLVDETILRRAEPGLVAYAQGRPFRRRGYQLAADLVASGLGLDLANPRVVDPADLLAKLEAFDAGALFTPLAVVLGSAATQPDWVALTPTQRRDRMQAAVADLIAQIAARRRLVLVVEDLQWIDPESQEALDRIVSCLPDLALLLVVTGRPEWRCPWRPAEWLQELHLPPLSEPALRNLLATRLAGNHAAHLSRVLAQRASGNPLFAELMLSGLVDDGVLLDLGANFHVLREASVGQLPPTIRGLLSERVDRLPAGEKRALQAAAVIGPR